MKDIKLYSQEVENLKDIENLLDRCIFDKYTNQQNKKEININSEQYTLEDMADVFEKDKNAEFIWTIKLPITYDEITGIKINYDGLIEQLCHTDKMKFTKIK